VNAVSLQLPNCTILDDGAVAAADVTAASRAALQAGFQLVYDPGFGGTKQDTQSTPSEGWQVIKNCATWLHSSVSPYSMGLSWNGQWENAWMLEYTRKDAPGADHALIS
jgi:hypothetical protein